MKYKSFLLSENKRSLIYLFHRFVCMKDEAWFFKSQDISLCPWRNLILASWLSGVTAGSLLELKGILIRNLGFFLDMATFFMALGHYLYIWWLHGMAFHLVDAFIFLNIRVIISFLILHEFYYPQKFNWHLHINYL